MMTLKDKINKFIEDAKLNYYKSNDQDEAYRILLPYRYKDIAKTIIFIDVYNDMNLLKMGFRERINTDEIESVKTKLLDKNGKLIFGTLSLEKESNMVSFSLDWFVDADDDITVDTYDKNIIFILNVYCDLLEEGIISPQEGI